MAEAKNEMVKVKKAPKEKQAELKPYEYLINEKKKAVVYAMPAHGYLFIGTSKCGKDDAFDLERGKNIARLRAEINMRSFDRDRTVDFIQALQRDIRILTAKTKLPVSTHFMHAIQHATEERKEQEKHIARLREELLTYTHNYDK